MEFQEKRRPGDDRPEDVQAGNARRWTSNSMSYDRIAGSGSARRISPRHYSKDSLADIVRLVCDDLRIDVFGQDAGAIPLPRRLREIARRLTPQARVARMAAARGSFLFVTARKASAGAD